jgi:diacylglycerol kinase family enzyme
MENTQQQPATLSDLSPKLFFIVNPQASGYDGKLEELLKENFDDSDYELAFTEQLGDGARLVHEFITQYSTQRRKMLIVPAGGDGLVCEVLAAVAGLGIANKSSADLDVGVFVVPVGTANIFAEEIGATGDMQAVINKLKELVNDEATLQESFVDMAKVNGKFFALRLNIGLFAQTTTGNNAELKKRWGRFSYVFAFLENLFQGNNFRVKLKFTDDKGRLRRKRFSCRSLTVTNAGATGIAGLPISQQIRIDDGLLDVIIFRRLWLTDIFSWLMKIILRQKQAATASKHYQCQSISIALRNKTKVEVIVDDNLVSGTQFDIEVVPKAVKILI